MEASTADKLRRGMTPDQALRAARVEMGSANAVKHHIRSEAWETKLEIFSRDLWYGVRMLARSPALPLIAVLTLALGIGANTAIFQLLDAVRLRNLPVRNPDELTVVHLADLPGLEGQPGNRLSGSEQSSLGIFSRPSACLFASAWHGVLPALGITVGDHEQLVQGLWVSGDFFNALGVRPALGRLFTFLR